MASTATEPTAAGDGTQRNVGRIEEIQGVVIEAVFPERLPEINHAITSRGPTAAAEEEAARHQRRGRRGACSCARSSSTSATTACARSRWTPPTASRAAPR